MNSLVTIFTAGMLVVTASLVSGYDLKDVTYRTRDLGSIVFSHKGHLQQKSIRNNCKACHRAEAGKSGHVNMAAMEKGASCGACHNGRQAFDLASCERCHLSKIVRLKSREAGAITFSHKSHLERAKCGSCHPYIFKAGPNRQVGMAAMEKGASCGACHGSKSAIGLDKCSSCHPVRAVPYRVAGASTVTFSHDLHLERFRCPDCHGAVYARPGGRKSASMVEMAKGKACGGCHDDIQAFTVNGNCAKCHKVT